jgi:uncharacterized protein (TIGR02246 family)
MNTRAWGWLIVAGVLVATRVGRAQAQTNSDNDAKAGAAAGIAETSSKAASGSDNKDEEAIRKAARDFSAAFAKGDAKAIAALWAENGEFEDDVGQVLRGRDAIEKSYTEMFKEQPGGKLKVTIQSIRFLTPDVAVEEGILRSTSSGRELPSTTRYSAIDVRENGQWKVAQCREWGVGQEHLDDLNWLVGKWKGTAKDAEMSASFAWDEKQPILVAKLATKPAAGKSGAAAQSATIKIGFDPQHDAFHSWHCDQDGAQSRAQWRRDGNRWLIDSSGMTMDGEVTSGQFILARIDDNNITWRTVNRTVGDKTIPDSMPIKLTRVVDGK